MRRALLSLFSVFEKCAGCKVARIPRRRGVQSFDSARSDCPAGLQSADLPHHGGRPAVCLLRCQDGESPPRRPRVKARRHGGRRRGGVPPRRRRDGMCPFQYRDIDARRPAHASARLSDPRRDLPPTPARCRGTARRPGRGARLHAPRTVRRGRNPRHQCLQNLPPRRAPRRQSRRYERCRSCAPTLSGDVRGVGVGIHTEVNHFLTSSTTQNLIVHKYHKSIIKVAQSTNFSQLFFLNPLQKLIVSMMQYGSMQTIFATTTDIISFVTLDKMYASGMLTTAPSVNQIT